MAKREYSAYQQKAIKRYYDNIDGIALQRLQELVTDLYLADTPAKQERQWERVAKAMAKLGVPQSIQDHILEKHDVQVLAMNVEDWVKQAAQK